MLFLLEAILTKKLSQMVSELLLGHLSDLQSVEYGIVREVYIYR